MKQIAGIEILRVVKELKEKLLEGKLNKIYVDRTTESKKELFFEVFVSGKGKQMLRIVLPYLLFITAIKPEMPAKPDGYCSYLRKYVYNAKIRDIEQVWAERIIKITLEGKDTVTREAKTYFAYIELFSKGNFILTDDKNIILSPLEIQQWSERTVMPKKIYMYPRLAYNPYNMQEQDVVNAIQQSAKDTIVTTLALDFGLGGLYAEEVCQEAGINKDTAKPTAAEAKKIYAAFCQLKNNILTRPAVIVRSEEKVIDVLPCMIKKYATYTHKEYPSFLQALDTVFAPEIQKKQEIKTKQQTALTKIQTMIKSQEKQIKDSEEIAAKQQRIGETIYENYHLIEALLKEINESRKKKSWKEIEKQYKTHKHLRQINEKNKEIIVEL